MDLRRFYRTPTKSGINIGLVEWSVLFANVLDFRFSIVIALSNYGANYCLHEKWCKFWVVRPPFVLGGHFEEIGIAKVLLNSKPRRVGKFRGCRFSDVSESVAREKKLSAIYNGSLALATLERTTIIIIDDQIVCG